MTHEAVRGLQMLQASKGGGLGDQILPDGVSGGAVGEGENVSHEGQGEAFQVIDMILRQLKSSPVGCGARIGIEVPSIYLSDGGPIVIARNGYVVMLAEEVDHLAGIGAVADDVTEAPDLIYGAAVTGVGQDSLECFEVGVDIGED